MIWLELQKLLDIYKQGKRILKYKKILLYWDWIKMSFVSILMTILLIDWKSIILKNIQLLMINYVRNIKNKWSVKNKKNKEKLMHWKILLIILFQRKKIKKYSKSYKSIIKILKNQSFKTY